MTLVRSLRISTVRENCRLTQSRSLRVWVTALSVCLVLRMGGAAAQRAQGNRADARTQSHQERVAAPQQLWVTKSSISGISADGRLVVSRDMESAGVILHDLRSSETRLITDEHRAVSGPHEATAQLSPDGQWVAFAVGPQFLGPWELRLVRADGREIKSVFRSQGSGGLRPLAWTSDSRQLLCLAQTLERSAGQLTQKNGIVLVAASSGAVQKVKDDLGPARLGGISGSLSPDGRYIAYSGGLQTRIFSVEGTLDVPITIPGGPDSRVLGWLPGSEDLVIGAGGRDSASFGIYRIPIHAGKPGNPELLRGGLETFDAVGVDASGALYYDVQHHGLTNAYIVGLDRDAGKLTGQPKRLTSSLENLNAIPMWSPDGKKAAWIGLESAYRHMDGASIAVRDLATGIETTVPIRLPAKQSMPQWMPSPMWMSDNRHMLMMAVDIGSDANHIFSLYKVDSESGVIVDVLGDVARSFPGNDPPFSQVAWSGDGSVMYRVEGLKSIGARQGSSGEWKTILTDPAATRVYEPTPSPDGTEIAYVAELDPNGRSAQIKVAALATGQIRMLVNVKPIQQRRQIVWTPDGRHLVYPTASGPLGPSQLWIVAAAGGTPKALGTPMEGLIFDLSTSPDGKQIGFTLRTIRHELWAVKGVSKR